MTAPRLVIGIGNPSRGDDALGPACIEGLEALAPRHTELLTDFQLQVEYLLDLAGRREVIFVDADAAGPAPFRFAPVTASDQPGCSTHAVPPGDILAAYHRHYGTPPPASHVLAIRGYRFDLGAPLSVAAAANLEAALAFLVQHLGADPGTDTATAPHGPR